MAACTRRPRLRTSRAPGGTRARPCEIETGGRQRAAASADDRAAVAPHPVDLEDTVSGLLQPPDPLDVATVPEGTAHPDFDAILYDWRRLAALAWSGFVTAGRGIVVVDLRDDGPRFGFEPGPPCECHARWLSEYDPTEEVLIVVRRGAEEWIFRLGGWPTPPEAFDELQDAGTVLRP